MAETSRSATAKAAGGGSGVGRGAVDANGRNESAAPPDRPGWTAAWSHAHKAWYWWNSLMQTTWDDPQAGQPRIVPSRLVKQPANSASADGQGVTQQQVDALPHVHSILGDLNDLSMKALRNICITRNLATRGRRVDLVCRLIGHDVSQAEHTSGTTWQNKGHARVGGRVCRPRAEPETETRDQADLPPNGENGAGDEPRTSATSGADAKGESGVDPSADSSTTNEVSATVRGIVTAWKPADNGGGAVQFYVVLQDGREEVCSEADVEAAVAAYEVAFGSKKPHSNGGRARHGERARAREGLASFRLGKWNEEEISKLDEALRSKDIGSEDWHTISKLVGTRSHLQVYDFQRRRIEAMKKREDKEEKASLELLIQQYMNDHGLAQFDKTSVGITSDCMPDSVMDWLTSSYGKDEAPSLATKLRNFLYTPEKTNAETPGQTEAEPKRKASDSTEDARDVASNGKRPRTSAKGLPWTAAEERHLEKLVTENGRSTAGNWQEKARALGTQRSGNSVHQRWKLIQLGGGVLHGDGTVSRSWPTGYPTFDPAGIESTNSSGGGNKMLETNLVDVNCYKIKAGKDHELRITSENPPRFSVYDLVKIVCKLDVQDTIETEEKQLLFARVPGLARCASKRNRSQSWLATSWRYVDRIIGFCGAIRDQAHAIEAQKFRSTDAFRLIEKLISALQQQGPSHPVARALQLQTGASHDEPAVHTNGTVSSLPDEADFRKDLKRMCRDRTLVGQRLSVYWGGDQRWYSGRVLECRKGKEFKIVYDDGEVSWESVEFQIGVRFLDAATNRALAARRAAAQAGPQVGRKKKKDKKKTKTVDPPEEMQEWKVLNFINSEPYEPSDIRLTGEKPPRIALRDFLECVLDIETGSETKQRQIVKQLRRNLRKNIVQEYIFVDERGREDQTEVVPLTELGKIFPLLPSNLTNRVRETGDLHRLQKMLRQESGIARIEMSVEAPGPGPVLQGLQSSRGGRGAGKAGKAAPHVNLKDWQEMWSPVLCLPSGDARGRVIAAARNSDPYVDPAPASLRLESRQLMTQASGHSSLPRATSRHPGYIRPPRAPTAELRWLCTTGNLTGRRVSVYWPKDDLWYDGTVNQCQPGRFKLTYDSNYDEDAADDEPAVVRWEVLGIGVHLLTQLPVGETMRKMFATRSRTVNGRGRPVHTAPRLRHRQSASSNPPSLSASFSSPDTVEDDEYDLDPMALTILMAPPFRVEGNHNRLKPAPGDAASNRKHSRGRRIEDEQDQETQQIGDTSAWTPKEEALLRQVVISLGAGRWEAKVAAMKSKRTWMALALRYGAMLRRQKNDPLLKRGFRLFNASPSTNELKAARSAVGIYQPCEKCGGKNDGSYGTGRFCSQSCKNKHSAHVKNMSTGAVPTNPSKRLKSSSFSKTEDDESDKSEHRKADVVARQCQQCGCDVFPPFYGSGRFCGQACGARYSKSVRDKRDASRRAGSSTSEDERDGDSEGEDIEDNATCAARLSRVGQQPNNQSHDSRYSSRSDRRLPKRQRVAPKAFVAGPASRDGIDPE